MRDKTRVVVFTDGKAKVLINPEESEYLGKLHIINPSMDRVENLPIHAYALEEGKLVPAHPIIQLGNRLDAVGRADSEHKRRKRAHVRASSLRFILLLLGNVGLTLILLRLLK